MCIGDLASYRPAAAEHLEELGWAVAETELAAVARYAEAIPLLRVFHPSLPCIGESISAVPVCGQNGSASWWYRLSDGGLLAPCADPTCAVERLHEALAPILQVVTRNQAVP